MRHFITCHICGAAGHSAKNCTLARLEEQRDPVGELMRRQGYRLREQERLAKKQGTSVTENVQTSRGFGM